ncbi:MAG: glycosyltransferase [Chlorobi bacterium]|nr:glycosyltransferase [Chlorobiota bacterium]
MSRKRILVGVLNWGLGHATRMVPVIRDLIRQNYEPVIASDGAALEWLRRAFPDLAYAELPSYKVRYPRLPVWMPFYLAVLAWKGRRILQSASVETRRIVRHFDIKGIISDNRPGVRVEGLPAVYVTHQLHVEAGPFSRWATARHRALYAPFDRIWVPDAEKEPFLSGRLGHPSRIPPGVEYIGILSRFEAPSALPPAGGPDWLVVLSGPERQRTALEEEVVRIPWLREAQTVLVRGTRAPRAADYPPHWEVIDLADTALLENLILRAKKLILRSGYSSVMDLTALGKQALLVPTPGQYEQEYLAAYLSERGYFPSIRQGRVAEAASMPEGRWQVPSVPAARRFSFKLFER